MKKLCGYTIFCILVMQSSCSMESGVRVYARDSGIKVYNNETAKELLQKLGYPECRISNPLQIDEVFLLSEKIDLPQPSSAFRQDLSEHMKLGYEIRLIDCLFFNHGIPSGTTILASVKDGVMVKEWLYIVDN